MGSIFIDFRPKTRRDNLRISRQLHLVSGLKDWIQESRLFSTTVVRCDDANLWSPYTHPETGVQVALAGRVSFTRESWRMAQAMPGTGGWATKRIAQLYLQDGLKSLRTLSGNFSVFLNEPRTAKCHIVTDPSGSAPLYGTSTNDGFPAYSSHPDALASAFGLDTDLDFTSLAEFLTSGRLTHPFTYYKSVQCLAPGTIYTVETTTDGNPRVSSEHYFPFDYNVDGTITEKELADDLGQAFQESVNQRTLPQIGKPIVALSGGLDSRLILSCCPPESDVTAICFFDEENTESTIAKRIAEARGVSLSLLHREFDHYGSTAVDGVRISGGMASLASNHFLGFRKHIQDLHAGSLLTGCYCDYLFKGLAHNRKIHPLLRTESLAPFRQQYYRPFVRIDSEHAQQARERLDGQFPEDLRDYRNAQSLLRIECARVFPLAYEGDHTQRIIPQFVLPWYVPIVDNAILRVYLRTPVAYKLNASMFSRMVQKVCGPEISSIPDSNTGVPLDASRLRTAAHLYWQAFTSRIGNAVRPKLATRGSWPNWKYYVQNSSIIRDLWESDQSITSQPLQSLLGFDPFARPIPAWSQDNLELFLRILTLHIWFTKRLGSQGSTHS